MAKSAIKIRREGKNLIKVKNGKLAAIIENFKTIAKETRPTETPGILSQILENTVEIKKELKKKTGIKLWSQIAANSHVLIIKEIKNNPN